MRQRQNTVPMVMKALEILDAFRDHPEGLTYSELLALMPEVSKVSVYRILCSLVASGYMYKDARSNLFQLGAKFLELGRITERGQDLLVLLRPKIEALLEKFGETINVVRIENGELINVSTLEGRHALRVAALSNRSNILYSSAAGKAILAAFPADEQSATIDGIRFERLTPNTVATKRELRSDLASILKRGYALDREENLLNVRSVAIAVRNAEGYPIAAVDVTGPAFRLPEAKMHEIGRDMVATIFRSAAI